MAILLYDNLRKIVKNKISFILKESSNKQFFSYLKLNLNEYFNMSMELKATIITRNF